MTRQIPLLHAKWGPERRQLKTAPNTNRKGTLPPHAVAKFTGEHSICGMNKQLPTYAHEKQIRGNRARTHFCMAALSRAERSGEEEAEDEEEEDPTKTIVLSSLWNRRPLS